MYFFLQTSHRQLTEPRYHRPGDIKVEFNATNTMEEPQPPRPERYQPHG